MIESVRNFDRRIAPRAITLPRVDGSALFLNAAILSLTLVLLSGAVWLNAT